MANDMANVSSTTLTGFLLARIAEDEEMVEHMIPGRSELRLRADSDDRYDYEYIVEIDPARVLAECAAKRRIIERAESYGADMAAKATDQLGRAFDVGAAYAGRCAMSALAQPYADHPDFRQEWSIA